MLLAVLTALIVVRPFVRGEDPGQLSDFSDPTGMVLTLLTLAGCAGWAVWRLWARQEMLPLGPVEVGLFALAGLYFVGATFAPYSRAAYLAASEWLGLALLVFFARQMVTRPEEQQGLLAVLLATAVALSVQGVWQASYEMPKMARLASTPEEAVDEHNLSRLLTPTPLERAQQIEYLQRRAVSGPFFHPSSLSACLVLLLPGLVSAVVACVRNRAPRWLVVLTVLLVLLVAVLLGMTRDAVALAVLAVVGLTWAGLYWPPRLGGAKAGAVGGLVVAGLTVWGLSAAGQLSADLTRWSEVWPATRRLVEAHFWGGVGPAQFGFFYPRFMAATAGHRIVDPSGSFLEVLAEVGVGGLVLMLLVLAVFFRAVVRWWRAEAQPAGGRPPSEPAATAPQPVVRSKKVTTAAQVTGMTAAPAKEVSPALPAKTLDEPPLRWEYYLGGMLAALFSFVLRTTPMLGEHILPEAISAGLRAVAWFIAFGVLERVAWSRGEYVGGLVVGITALLLLLLVAPGLTYPSVAGLLWVAVALVLAVVSPPVPGWLGRQGWVSAIALPLFLGGGFSYLALIFSPAALAASNIQKAKLAGGLFIIDQTRKPDERAAVVDSAAWAWSIPRFTVADCSLALWVARSPVSPPDERTIRNPLRYINEKVIQPLDQADRDERSEDPRRGGNVRTRVLLASWWVQQWAISPVAQRNADTGGKGIAWAVLAQTANPEGREGYRAEYEARVRIAGVMRLLEQRMEMEAKNLKLPEPQRQNNLRIAQDLKARIQKQYLLAAQALEPYVPRDPTSPEHPYLIAAALFQAGDRVGGRLRAQQAIDLDNVVGEPRRLPRPQREQLLEWLVGRTSP
jgi:hypothetical protein